MQLEPTKSFVALIAACVGAGAAACSGQIVAPVNDADALVATDVQDSGRDISDVTPNDVQDVPAAHVEDVPETDVQDVLAADVQDDPGDVIDSCITVLPNMATLMSYTQCVNDTSAWYLDAAPVMFGSPGIFPFALIHTVASSPPDHMIETADSTCFYFATWEGSTARQNSAIEDRGSLTIQQASDPIMGSFDSVSGKYDFDLSMAVDASTGLSLWVPGMTVTATLAGGAGGSGGTSAALPLYPLIHMADFSFPNPISRTSDNTFTWNTPPGLPGDQVAMAVIIDNSDFSDGVWCFAPACQHRMTVPSAIMMYTHPSAMRQVLLVFPQVTPIGSGTDAVNFLLLNGVDEPGNTGP